MNRRGRRWRWFLAGTLALLLIGGAGTAFFQLGLPNADGGEEHAHVHRDSDGGWLHYQVHLPPQHSESASLPVMVALHGCGMTGFGWNSMEATTQFDALADREGFIVVYPSQRPFESAINCWNSADPRNQQRGSGEPALIVGVVHDVIETYGADASRVHVSGASSGAGAAVILGATYPDVFHTVTSVAGGEYGLNRVDPDVPDATPPDETARLAWAQMGVRERQVPLLIVQGGRDDVVSELVGERLVQHWLAVDDLVDDSLLNDSLGLEATTTSTPAEGGRHAFEHTVYAAGDDPALLEYYLIPAMGHAWSGPKGEGEYTDRSGPDVAELAWRFAERHDRAAAD